MAQDFAGGGIDIFSFPENWKEFGPGETVSRNGLTISSGLFERYAEFPYIGFHVITYAGGSDGCLKFTYDFTPASSTSLSVGTTVNAAGFSHLSGKFGDAADDDTAPSPTITGVGDGTATTIEDLLQKILDQVQANTLAPTLDVAGTETGDNTGTDEDEDSKPYLPYIPRIFSKLETLPQDIADKVKGLFVPDEAFIDALPAQIADIFDNRCGLLTYPASLMADFLTRLSTLTVQEPVFSWGNINEPFSGRQIIAAGSYNLNSAIQSDAMKTVYDTYIIVVKAMIALWFVELCRKKYNQIIRS